MANQVPEAPEADSLDDELKTSVKSEPRHCQVCEVKLSSYNPGPNCWSHTIGYPWRGPTAKPKYE